MPTVWVARLHISARTAAKITQRHDITPDEVREAIVCVPGLRGRWHDHPERGRRALVDLLIRGRLAVAVLYPSDSALGDEWDLGSVYHL